MRVLYVLSDFAYFILYKVIRYRVKVVRENLMQAFPDKPEAGRIVIEKKFYRNFTDNFIEVIKLISASEEFMRRRFRADFSISDEYYRQGRRNQLLLAHNFNWELACVASPLYANHPFLVVYMPIGSKAIDRMFIKIRSRTGVVLLPATDIRSAIIPYKQMVYTLVLVADQKPGNPASAYWSNFLGRPAPFVKGPESGARRGNNPVVFGKIIKKKRGHYQLILEKAFDQPVQTEPGEITRTYVKFLEQFIRDHPEMWLWSHKRWKWEWKEEYGPLI